MVNVKFFYFSNFLQVGARQEWNITSHGTGTKWFCLCEEGEISGQQLQHPSPAHISKLVFICLIFQKLSQEQYCAPLNSILDHRLKTSRISSKHHFLMKLSQNSTGMCNPKLWFVYTFLWCLHSLVHECPLLLPYSSSCQSNGIVYTSWFIFFLININ